MAKKKRRPSGDKPRRRKHPSDVPELPDRRAMEGVMRQLVAGMQEGSQEDTPLAKAHEILLHAYQEKDTTRRVQLAQQAIEICSDCADAYVLLAEHTHDRKEALALWEQAVAAGERALGPTAFQEQVGHFWGILETRPFMRAKEGLAHALWNAGSREEAIQHLQDMLRLNPGDNQGVRYSLASYLLNDGRDNDVARLVQQYPDEGSTFWAYTKALFAFRRKGDTPESRQHLVKATKANQYVPDFLLGKQRLPEEQPPHYSPGQENEAIIYARMFLSGWRNMPGAITWLRQSTRKSEPQPQPKGPLSFIKSWVQRHIPQGNDIWQAEFRQLPDWIVVAGEKVRHWTVLVTSRTHDLVLAHYIVDDAPTGNHLWDALFLAMQKPVAGEPHRPIQLQVRTDERWTILKPHVEEVGIELVENDTLYQMDAVFDQMHEHLLGTPRPSLLDMPGVSPAQVGSFFESAADFYQKSPWKVVGDDTAVRIDCDRYESGPWYGVVMGQAGMTLGLALYEDLRIVRKTQEGKLSDEGHASKAVVLSMTYGEQTDLTVKDLEALQKFGWKLAGPEAYPSVFKKERWRGNSNFWKGACEPFPSLSTAAKRMIRQPRK